MASLRKALTYSKKKARPYTRVSRAKSKSYIKVVPHNKVVKYNAGETRMFNEGKFNQIIRLVAEEGCQIRDNAIESSRTMITKTMDKRAPKQYYFAIKIYPHHILRNNKTAAGAGADRLSSGMKHSFGVVEGRAAMVSPGKEIFLIACNSEQGASAARDALKMVKSKLPCKTKISMEKVAVAN